MTNFNTIKAEAKKQLNLNIVELIERKEFKFGVETFKVKIKSKAGNILERNIFKKMNNGIKLEILK